ncbi:MAG: pyridoxal-phosphate dependent enzyme [Aigarchaeota archaeon]|nr:pyridoxal-phosphate dependent enzyme [Aigarchaeota archaeon]MDW7985981.1 pyridoxal-phosphate dependent enzyme [Nitrososphaerota archaeon]
MDNGVSIIVKLEYPEDFMNDPLRTIKRKPATVLFEDLSYKGFLKQDRVIVTASSGNFLRELALIALRRGFKILGVTPPRIPYENLRILTALGVNIINITEEYDLCPRETTVFYTRSLAENYRYLLVNVDQYISWQNVMSHIYTTWNEIKEIGEIDYACIPLGSTGTFMGISLASSLEKKKIDLIGVQPTRYHNIPGVHYIVGGCEWSPEIYSPLISKKIVTVDDIDAYAGLMMLWEKGVYSGPSTGMVFIQALKLAETIKEGRVLIISADSIFSYRDYVLRFLKEIRDHIISRYPYLQEVYLRYTDWLRRLPDIEERIEIVKKIYGVREEGRIYKFDDVEDLLKKLKALHSYA